MKTKRSVGGGLQPAIKSLWFAILRFLSKLRWSRRGARLPHS